MLKGFSRAIGVFVVLFFCFLSVNAEVRTVKNPEGDGIFVAGNSGFYPIEYYNSTTGEFEGVMPGLLKVISERTGLDFTYVYRKNTPQTELLKKLDKITVASAYMIGAEENYAVDEVEILTYEVHGKRIRVGLAFTEGADKEIVEIIKNEVATIGKEGIDGYIIKGAYNDTEDRHILLDFAIILLLILLIFIVISVRLKIKMLRKQISEDSVTDAETGIGNLAYFERAFNTIVNNGKIEEYSVLYLIIDNNYIIEDRRGKVYASAPVYVARLLEGSVGENEFIGRITESGFAIALARTEKDEVKEYAETIIDRLNAYSGVSDSAYAFHISVYRLNEDVVSSEFLIFNLRRLCNTIVGTENNIIFCSTDDMNSTIQEKKLVEDIVQGFKNKEFKLYLQFVIENETKRIVSAEALSRWKTDEGIVSPGKYIGVMESNGLISDFDYYMFELVCRQLHKWYNTELGNISISCNITRITLSDIYFIERIKEISARYVFDKSSLILDMTEDAMEENVAIARNNVMAVKSMGFCVALDDMGSGYTSLSNLCDYPIDVVKIDRSILLRTDKERGRDLFMGMVALAHSLGKKVVCEGVETKEQDSFVSDTSCDYIQGFYYSGVFPEWEARERYNKYNG